MKKISVIIPCYNVERWIDRCLTSIVQQTIGLESLEIICIDDASTDKTWERLREWEQRFPEDILLIRQEVNRRQGAARNVGLQYASAEWIAFIDADDWAEPDYLELLYWPVGKYACDAVCCESMRDCSAELSYFGQNSREIEGAKDCFFACDTEPAKKHILKSRASTTGACALIVRKELLIEQGIFFPESLVYEDRFWPPLLYSYVKGVYIVEKRLYHYFSNPYSTVYTEDNEHIIDWMTVQLMKWREYGRRGLFNWYSDELKYDALCDAVRIMTMICRHERPSFSLYQLERQIITERVADSKSNRYYGKFPEISRCMLEALYMPLDREGFRQFQETVKQMREVLKGLQKEQGC